MILSHAVSFDFELGLPPGVAVAFVRDVEISLSEAAFLQDLSVTTRPPTLVKAHLPVNAALFGQQLLEFQSRLIPTVQGARLEAVALETSEPGWAEVAGEATVQPAPGGSQVTYHFDIAIHLRLPTPERWGGKALTKMIEFTAQRVLENITQSFPSAVQAAAYKLEAAHAA